MNIDKRTICGQLNSEKIFGQLHFFFKSMESMSLAAMRKHISDIVCQPVYDIHHFLILSKPRLHPHQCIFNKMRIEGISNGTDLKLIFFSLLFGKIDLSKP